MVHDKKIDEHYQAPSDEGVLLEKKAFQHTILPPPELHARWCPNEVNITASHTIKIHAKRCGGIGGSRSRLGGEEQGLLTYQHSCRDMRLQSEHSPAEAPARDRMVCEARRTWSRLSTPWTPGAPPEPAPPPRRGRTTPTLFMARLCSLAEQITRSHPSPRPVKDLVPATPEDRLSFASPDDGSNAADTSIPA